MKYTSLEEYCRSIYELLNVPTMVYRKESGAIESGFFADNSFSEVIMNNPNITNRYMGTSMFDREHTVSYYISDDQIAFGSVLDKNSQYAVYIGPCLLSDPSENMMRSMLTRQNSPFRNDPDRYYDQIYSYILSLPRFTPERFLWLLSFSNNCINHEVSDPQDFYQASIAKNRLDLSERKVSDPEEDSDIYRRIRNDLFARIRILVTNGSVEKILEFWDISSGDYFRTIAKIRSRGDRLRFEKDLFIQFLTRMSELAEELGVSEKQTFRLTSSLIEEAEACIVSQQIETLYRKALISFTEEVRSVTVSEGNDSYLLRKAIAFIHDNIEKPVTASQIAEELNISAGHLSRIFNSAMKMKISDYVNTRKIAIAESLLSDTDSSLIEIAEYLSFSSQSYFQNIFKKYTGITPLRYRNESRYRDHSSK